MKRLLAIAAALGCGAAIAQANAPAEERFKTCLACHGEGGISALALTPSLGGQHSFYAITQLFLFREGRRSSEVMTAMAKGMSDADLRAFSELIAQLPPAPSVTAPGADAPRLARGAALAQRLRCASCHGADYAGGQQVPRLARQREDYLAKTLTEFRAGTRLGYTSAMAEALAGAQPDELADLAYYLANFGKATP